MSSVVDTESVSERDELQKTTLRILFAVSFCHFLNDTIQSIIPALYPLFKETFSLTFAQIGLITLTFQLTASILQPVVGYVMDLKPRPYSLAAGIAFTFAGLVILAFCGSYAVLLLAAALIGLGSAVFHPEASRMARAASGGRHGFAQSFFQVGGYTGTAIGPLLAVLIASQARLVWVMPLALISLGLLIGVGRWYQGHLEMLRSRPRRKEAAGPKLSRGRIVGAISVLLMLIFSKYFYLASITSYYTFYLMHQFGVSVKQAQVYLFVFLLCVAVGTLVGGPLGDRFGRKLVIWFSILGATPFTLALPHVSLGWTVALSIPIGLILSSAFSAIVVYAQELLPGRVGMVTGLFFGFAFGMGGIGSAVLGWVADHQGIVFVYQVCAWLPLIGLLTVFLPRVRDLAK